MFVFMCVSVCVIGPARVCARARACAYACMCVCVCVRERESEREREIILQVIKTNKHMFPDLNNVWNNVILKLIQSTYQNLIHNTTRD